MSSSRLKKASTFLKRLASGLFKVLGVIAFILLVLSFTDIPYWAYHSLAMTDKQLKDDPQHIIMLGGNGLPSPDGFIRTYYASLAAKEYSAAKIIIAIPGEPGEESSQPRQMMRELASRGIDTTRVLYENKGHNTRSQAVNIAAMFREAKEGPVLLITSPEHMYRSIRAFEAVGFADVAGTAAFESPLSEKDITDEEKPGDRQVRNLDLRYNMWSYLQYEIVVLREYTAIVYYKLKGWI